jgi:hypothetical protein
MYNFIFTYTHIEHENGTYGRLQLKNAEITGARIDPLWALL